MDFEGKFFVFDWMASYSEDTIALAVMRVVNGKLEERYHPNGHEHPGEIGEKQDQEAIAYLKKHGVSSVYVFEPDVEAPEKFLGATLFYQGLNDSEQETYFVFDRLDENKINLLKENGIEAILIDPTPYVTSSEQ